MGVVRGYFQGLGNMVPTSISQVIEQVVNAIISVAASFAFMHWFANWETPAAYGAAGGTLGTLSGALAAFVFLTLLMFFTADKMQRHCIVPRPTAWKAGIMYTRHCF